MALNGASIPADLTCQVCLGLLNNPEETPCCEEVYCGRCIRDSLSRAATCPNCREPLCEDQLQEARRQLLTLIGDVVISCPKGCGATMARGTWMPHVACDCPAASDAEGVMPTPRT